MKYPNASREPLDIIEHNECNHDSPLSNATTARIQRLFNEIEDLQSRLAAIRAALAEYRTDLVLSEPRAFLRLTSAIDGPQWWCPVHGGLIDHGKDCMAGCKEPAAR